MPSKSIRHLTRLPLYLFLQPAIRPSTTITIIHHALRAPKPRYLSSSTPYHIRKSPTNNRHNGFTTEPPKHTSTRTKFTGSDAPPLSFWETYARPPLVPPDTVTPEACHTACKQYVSLALENLPNWQRRCPSLFTLQYVILVLMNSPGSTALAMHITHTLVSLDYAPAILSLAYLGFRSGQLESNIHLTQAKQGLERLSSLTPPNRSSSSSSTYRADALTLAGLIAASRQTPKDDTRALNLFTEASTAFTSSATAQWQWRASAVLAEGKIHARRSRPDLARAVYAAHARELDNADVLYAYAMLLERTDPARVPMLERAAVSACAGAAREMARVELERAEDAGLSKGERYVRRVLADEWLRIAGEKEAA
ncbi:uncharacterized protein F4807DRAFT_456774 [Annulohypoxylon truncatum]|uniref:uncharacterized protein n=1 Tax=Annulohypoxylon truncatum TaxID=327061 RepID=UPI0020081E81|nr:uncharacterized protein F4807DRAFT_456774 [Annulohypoxylon truncatum]KAI1213431.1 hypothetical protein F4807DRAFT_456774 [Annulohypoxylon truncatum]